MADISKISVNDVTYDLKDSVARQNNTELVAQLGELAFKDSATGTFTPDGTITAPTINVTPTTASIKGVNNVGALPNWGANVSEETLSFSFTPGSLPTTSNHTVVTGIADATASTPLFSGVAGNVTVS